MVYYQEDTGPENYRPNNANPPMFTLGNQYDYPLVTVEISTGTIIRHTLNFKTL